MRLFSRNQLFVLAFVGVLALGGIVAAAIPAIRGSGLQVDLNTSATGIIASGKAGLWGKSADGLPYWRKTDGTDVSMSGGGGGGTVIADAPITGDGSSGSHLACAVCAVTNSTNTFTGALTVQVAIGASLTAGLNLNTTSTATSGNQKWSYSAHFGGSGWGTTGGAAQAVSADLVLIPVQGTTAKPHFSLYMQDGGGSSTERWVFTRENGVNQIDADNFFITGATNGVFIGPTIGSAIGIGNGSIDSSPGDGYVTIGGIGARYFKAIYTWWNSDKLGSQLTAASTITPVYSLHHVTGATTINTIDPTNVPSPGGNTANTRLTLVADGGTITWSAAGNIGAAGTIAQNKAQIFQYDATATTWYPLQ